MSRNIPNKPHPTPNPDKHHSRPSLDRSNVARPVGSPQASGGQTPLSADEGVLDESAYDLCFDDLDRVLSQSIEQPDPDPNLDSAASVQASAGSQPGDPSPHPAKPPRTSEIFRSVVSVGGEAGSTSVGPEASIPPAASPAEPVITDLGVDVGPLSRPAGGSTDEDAHQPEVRVPWGQILLLSYSSAITLALIWMIWTGRFGGAGAPAPADRERPTPEAATKAPDESAATASPPLPAENVTSIGRGIRIGDLEVTPVAITASTVQLVRTIDPDKKRRAEDCLILRLRLTNHSGDQTFAPLEQDLVRERELRPHDPYIESAGGPSIRFFPLAVDSEWSIFGQRFPVLGPGESGETFVAAEPGSASRLADEMTWRVRLRIGVYRTDMLGVRFNKDEVRVIEGGGRPGPMIPPEDGDTE